MNYLKFIKGEREERDRKEREDKKRLLREQKEKEKEEEKRKIQQNELRLTKKIHSIIKLIIFICFKFHSI
jgi:hypothetical protein